jgi:hypothetical protein
MAAPDGAWLDLRRGLQKYRGKEADPLMATWDMRCRLGITVPDTLRALANEMIE